MTTKSETTDTRAALSPLLAHNGHLSVYVARVISQATRCGLRGQALGHGEQTRLRRSRHHGPFGPVLNLRPLARPAWRTGRLTGRVRITGGGAWLTTRTSPG